jgi:hypothetical protein
MGCFCGVYLSWIVNREIQNHGHRVDLSIDPPCYDVDDPSLGVSHDHRTNDRLVDHSMDDGLTTVANLCLRMNGTDDRNLDVNHVNRNCVRRDLMMDAMTDGNLCRRMNDLLGDHSMDDDHHDALVGLRRNVMDDQNDRNLVAKMDVSRDLRMNDLLDDHSMDDGLMKGANHDHRMSVMGDRNDLKMDGTTDVSRGHHMNGLLDDLNLDANHVNRNCVRRDQMKDVNLDAMSHRVMYY